MEEQKKKGSGFVYCGWIGSYLEMFPLRSFVGPKLYTPLILGCTVVIPITRTTCVCSGVSFWQVKAGIVHHSNQRQLKTQREATGEDLHRSHGWVFSEQAHSIDGNEWDRWHHPNVEDLSGDITQIVKLHTKVVIGENLQATWDASCLLSDIYYLDANCLYGGVMQRMMPDELVSVLQRQEMM